MQNVNIDIENCSYKAQIFREKEREFSFIVFKTKAEIYLIKHIYIYIKFYFAFICEITNRISPLKIV